WVHEFGKAAYTFDAGPNPHILVLEENVQEVVNFLEGLGAKVIVSKIGKGPSLVRSET
ncbi:MAG: diphosphomevalonate decarboxylase, partial [Metallosphaera sp.]